MHWFGYVLLATPPLVIIAGYYIFSSYRTYRQAWRQGHLDELMRELWSLKAEQLLMLRTGESLPSSFISSAGVRLALSIDRQAGDDVSGDDGPGDDMSGDGQTGGGFWHHLVAECRGFFGQILAEETLAFALQRYGYAASRVAIYITSYSADGFHAKIELTEKEHEAWAASTLVLLGDRPAIEEAREYRQELGRPRVLSKSFGKVGNPV